MDKLDKIILEQLGNAISDTIKSRLGGYNTPLSKMVDEAVLAKKAAIESLLREAIDQAFDNQIFRDEIKEAFTHSLARSLMNDFKGEVEKQAQALRQNPEFRARVVLAIERVVRELDPTMTEGN